MMDMSPQADGGAERAQAAEARQFAASIRRVILEQSKRANVGHIGSALSIADIVATLFCGPLRGLADRRDPLRDRFILSKGHAALALYAALFLRGTIQSSDLRTFCGDGTLLGVHPDCGLPGIDFSTGSLGHGLSIGAGAALAARMARSTRRVFVVISDAECNEGSVWEAAMFAAHHKLANLVAFIDVNGQQALGFTRDVLDLEPLGERWRAFGWKVSDVDGHDVEALGDAATSSDGHAPHAILARTTFGKGVAFMHSQILWHYRPMSDAEYAAALAGLEIQA
jgi:transketolase